MCSCVSVPLTAGSAAARAGSSGKVTKDFPRGVADACAATLDAMSSIVRCLSVAVAAAAAARCSVRGEFCQGPPKLMMMSTGSTHDGTVLTLPVPLDCRAHRTSAEQAQHAMRQRSP